MQSIQPLSFYHFQPVSTKRTTSTDSTDSTVDDLSKLFKTSTELNDSLLSKTAEDPDTAWSNWAEKEFFHNPFETQHKKDLILSVETACKLHEIYESLPKVSAKKNSTYFRSFKHLTLPEALIYRYLLTEPPLKKNLYARYHLEKEPTPSTPLILSLVLFEENIIIKRWILTYNLSSLIVLITEEGNKTGHIRYIIRERRLEEIEGTYLNEPFILDPVWNTKIRGALKEEYITLGKFKATLIYNHNEKYAVYRNPQSTTSTYTEKKNKHYIKDNRTVVTEKTVTLAGYHCLNRIVFAKGYILPIGGQFFISTNTDKH